MILPRGKDTFFSVVYFWGWGVHLCLSLRFDSQSSCLLGAGIPLPSKKASGKQTVEKQQQPEGSLA